MELKEMLFELSSAVAVTGFEEGISKKIKEYLKEYSKDIKTDIFGNITARIPSAYKNAPTIMLDAHIDEIGLMVSGILDGGFLRLTPLGGIDPRILPASEVIVHGKKNMSAVISVKPPHIKSDDDNAFGEVKDLFADTGTSLEKLKELVTIGDIVSFAAPPLSLCGSFVAGKSFDNRAGVSVLFTVLEKLKGKELPYHLVACFSVQEEVGLRGAKVAAEEISPDFAIVLDTGHGETPDAPTEETFRMEGGPMIGVGPNLDRKITEKLIRFAKEKEIPYQLEVMGGNTGTNAWALQIAKCGIPCGLLSVPLRYMHTKSEVVSLKDILSAAEIILLFLQNFEEVKN